MVRRHRPVQADFPPPIVCPRFLRQNSKILLAATFLMLAALFARADDFWKAKPSSEWTLAQALKLIQRSPWAHQEVIPVSVVQEDVAFRKPIGGQSCDPDAFDINGKCKQSRVELPQDSSRRMDAQPALTPSWGVLVRWESAVPVTQAFARLTDLDAKAAAEYQSRPPRLPADRYVVTVKMVESGRQMIDPFARPADGKSVFKAILKTRRGMLEAKETEYSGNGAASAIHYFFPREVDGAPLFGPGREAVEFILQGAHFKIKSKFTLDPAFLR